jgi:hypothetical protein
MGIVSYSNRNLFSRKRAPQMKYIILIMFMSLNAYAEGPKFYKGNCVAFKSDDYGQCTGSTQDVERILSTQTADGIRKYTYRYEVRINECDSGYGEGVERWMEESLLKSCI